MNYFSGKYNIKNCCGVFYIVGEMKVPTGKKVTVGTFNHDATLWFKYLTKLRIFARKYKYGIDGSRTYTYPPRICNH